MLKLMILAFAGCALVAAFGVYLIFSYLSGRTPGKRGANPLVAAGIAFAVVWGGMSLGFLHWISTLS